MRTATCVALLVAAFGRAQQTPAEANVATEDQKAFLARLARALREDEAPARVGSFSAKVTINVDLKQANADVEATVDFLEPGFLKTVVKEGGSTVVRGVGKRLPWMKNGDQVFWLQGKDWARDREAVYRDLTIAAAMTRVLYPDRQIEALVEVEGPVSGNLRLSRREPVVPALRMTGIAKPGQYPLALSPEHRGPVRLTAWFRKADLYPLVIQLVPLADTKERKKAGPVEELRFHDHRKFQALVLPGRILFRGEQKDGRARALQTVRLIRFEVNPARLKPESFAKPSG